MKETGDREIHKLDKKISSLKRIFIVGIIITIIGLCGITITMIKTTQIKQELQENIDEGFSDLTEEDELRQSEINRELDLMWFLLLIFGPLLAIGPLITISAFNHKRNFSQLRESHLNPPKTGVLETSGELSFIPNPGEE